jgi:tRNA threonylcarbamoyladenosine biosynthesis protein TsaB
MDTATAYQSVAVLDETTILAEAGRDAEGSHAKLLLGATEQVLRTAGLALKDLDGFALSIGPGSFTGLRVGLATLLGFRSVLGTPLVAVPTLEAMAWNLRSASDRICPVLKSRRNEVYWAAYEWLPGQRLHRLAAEQVGSLERVAGSIQHPVVVLGDGWQAYGGEIKRLLGTRAGLVTEAPAHAMRPSAVSVALAARERFARMEVAGSGIVPFYVQRAEAEITYEETGGMSPVERRKRRVARRTHAKRGPVPLRPRGPKTEQR